VHHRKTKGSNRKHFTDEKLKIHFRCRNPLEKLPQEQEPKEKAQDDRGFFAKYVRIYQERKKEKNGISHLLSSSGTFSSLCF
jgi:hypothetical protein